MKLAKDRPVTILIVGAGGTGGYIILHLYRIAYASDRYCRIIIADGDVIEHKNLIRQNFAPCDIGENKAAVMAERYSEIFGIETKYIPDFIENEKQLLRLLTVSTRYNRPKPISILIGAVDNNRSRIMCHNVFNQMNDLIYIDSGNGEFTGQVVCGIKFHGVQRNNIELKALCPFCGDTKYHLGLNRQKEMFHCFRCGEKGKSITLYAKIFGLSNKEAYKAIRDDFDAATPNFVHFENEPEMPIRCLSERHNVYYDFLQLLRLQSCHRENLISRGLSFSDIHRFMYRSLPTDRVFRREVLEKLSSMYDLTGIPMQG